MGEEEWEAPHLARTAKAGEHAQKLATKRGESMPRLTDFIDACRSGEAQA